MWTCEHCREQMLSFLYDLLEPAEKAMMITHLQSCPACQEAHGLAQEQQGLLAEAVKESHPGVVFKAPVKAVPASTVPTLALPAPQRRPFFLNRWSIAAAVLICLMAGGSVLGVLAWNEQNQKLGDAQERLAQAEQERRRIEQDIDVKRVATQREIREIQAEIDKLTEEWRARDAEARKAFEQQTSQLKVSGPQTVVAGGQNYFQIEVNNRDQALPGGMDPRQQQAGEPIATNMRVIDQKDNRIVFEQQINFDALRNTANVMLPPNLPVKPGSKLAMEFDLYSRDGHSTQRLGDNLTVVAPEYLTHLATDRPLYRPGDTIRFRSITLERFSLRPAQEPFNLRFRVLGPRNVELYRQELTSLVTDADQNPIKGPDGKPLTSLGVGEFTLPEHAPAGQYSVIVSDVNERFAEEKRSFIVNRIQPVRLHKEVAFHRSSYGAGDTVRITVKAAPAQGFIPGARGLNITCKAVVDNVNVAQLAQQTNNEGETVFEFPLPPQIFKGVGKVEVICSDGGNAETVVRTIPIAVRDLTIDFYPEGGDLVAGVPNRVYYQARTPAGRPADVQARLVNDLNQEIARTQTLTDDAEPGINQGLGSFTFTPVANRRYSLRLDAPIGITRAFPLPTLKKSGVVLHVPQGVVEKEIPITIHAADRPRDVMIGAYCRGRLVGQAIVFSKPGKPAQTVIRPDLDVAGVYRITAFEVADAGGRNASFQPVAERLIYRPSSERVDIAIVPDRSSYQPRDTVKLTLSTSTEKKAAAPALAMVAVVDASNLKAADEKNARSMPTHFLLTNEIRDPADLENADVFLGSHPKAAQALDLLLGSQGWRRFAEQDPRRFLEKTQNAKAPAFLGNAYSVVHFSDSEQRQIEKVDQAFVSKAIELQRKLAAKEQEEEAVPNPQQVALPELQASQMARAEVENIQSNQRALRAILLQFVLGGVLLALLFFGFLLINTGLHRLVQGAHARTWFTCGIGLLMLLFLASVIGTFAMMGERFDDFGHRHHLGMKPPVAIHPGFPPPGMERELPPETQVQQETLDELDEQPAGKKPIQPAAAPQVWPGNRIGVDLDPQVQFFPNQEDQVKGKKQEQLDERWLRQQGHYQPLLQRQVGRRVHLPPVTAPGVVREYAHRIQPANKDEARRDLVETLYWHPVLVLPDGQGQVSFDLGDSVARYQALVIANAFDGRLGAHRIDLTARLPFSLDPRVPTEVSNKDEVTIPVTVDNEQGKASSLTLSARLKGLNLTAKNADRGLELKANQKQRELFNVKPTIDEGTASVRVLGRTTGSSDAVERKFKVVQEGFPVSGSVSGLLENVVEREITLPDDWIPGSLKVQAHVYPTPLAELQSALDSLLREPTGCFEQSASCNYANVLLLNYMKQTNQSSPLLEKRARDHLRSGSPKLTAFECVDPQTSTKRGYEWFGGEAPPHEALTAYALMQFRDMTRVHPVDADMLQRTERYLLQQRDGKGGFTRNPPRADRLGQVPEPVMNAYLLWALTESGVKENLDAELAGALAACKERKDPYLLALVALSHLNRNKANVGIDLLKRVRHAQRPEGKVAGAGTSITGSKGRDLEVETTALALLGWLKASRPDEFNASIQSAFNWLGQQRRDQGSFGSTQATVLALKAMLAHARAHPRAMQAGEVQMIVRDAVGQVQGQQPPRFNRAPATVFNDADLPELNRVNFSAGTRETLTLTLRDAAALRPGKNSIELRCNNNAVLPYTLTWSCRTLQPDNTAKAPVKLTTRLAEQAKENESVKLSAVVENVSDQGQGMTVAIIGLPGGVTLPENFEQLKELARRRDNGSKPGTIDAWEVRGREVVLYWRELAPGARVEVEFDVICRLPGHYHGPASRAYPYYDADRKHWTSPLSIRIHEIEPDVFAK